MKSKKNKGINRYLTDVKQTENTQETAREIEKETKRNPSKSNRKHIQKNSNRQKIQKSAKYKYRMNKGHVWNRRNI